MKTHLGRRPFSAMELHTLYNGYIYGDVKVIREQPKHWHFWLPLISYYSGAYSDEIGYLTLDDLIFKQNILCFSFHTHGKIKPRLVPVHKALINYGLNEYIAFIKSQNQHRLMFDLPAKTGRYSEKVRIWFSGEGERAGYLQKCDIPNVDQLGMKTAISSLRLNFEQQVRIHALQANSKDAFNYLMGFNEYSCDEFNDVLLLNNVIQKIRTINSHLHWQRFITRESH
ncbi:MULTISPECIES: hypothetical protein [Pseudoalteromonas]|uniref:Orphan protein n=1 Tax=Pseudoalteromonas fuliginea TaxID=1872678 RepID=A0ABD3Y9B7_9GAMM|nr:MULTISPECIES: hypothetical protein [Pseudoalteromonas]ATG76587.1 hypothetical protein AOR04_02960 [Pseudoalteromonas sp. 1_2015MBL_MicDiv]KDC50847.1 hypothetical protein DC53_11040 [Pseudoalteromonas fuliginea]KJZ26886.1 hypothetical protein TW82_14975 [Pseudoalteromonas fuliginea]